MSDPSSTLQSAAETLLGGFFVTVVLSIMLYGITTTQAYLYWMNFPDDLKIIKWTVFGVWILETMHTVFCIHMLYYYVIKDFGNLVKATEIVWSTGATVFTEVTLAAVVQGFFIRRIYILSHKSIIMTVVPSIFLVARAGMSYGSGVLTWTNQNWSTFDTSRGPKITVTCGLTFAAATDICVAAILIYYLQSSRTGFQGTDHLIRRMQSYVINSGALTMVASTSIVLTFAFLKSSLIFVGLVQVQGKLYANSFLGTLNSRGTFGSSTRNTSQDVQGSSVELSARRQNEPKNGLSSRPIEIFQHVSSEVADGLGPTSYKVDRDDLSSGKSQSLV